MARLYEVKIFKGWDGMRVNAGNIFTVTEEQHKRLVESNVPMVTWGQLRGLNDVQIDKLIERYENETLADEERHFLFKLSMPENNAWNGKWTGADKNYVLAHSFNKRDKRLSNFEDGVAYRYAFGDGWVAAISVTEVTEAEKIKAIRKSDGFCGYEWMVDSLIATGDIMTESKRKEALKSGTGTGNDS